MSRQTLGEFIQRYLEAQGISRTKLAERMKVDPSSVSKFYYHGLRETYSGKPIGDPSVDFLRKLAIETNTPGTVIFAMVAPETARDNPRAVALAHQIAEMPDDKIELLFEVYNVVTGKNLNKISQ